MLQVVHKIINSRLRSSQLAPTSRSPRPKGRVGRVATVRRQCDEPSRTILLEARRRHLSPQGRRASTTLAKARYRIPRGERFAKLRTLFAGDSRRLILPACSILGLATTITMAGIVNGASSVYATNTATLNLTANVAEPGLELSLSSNNVTLNLAAPYTGTSFDSSTVTATVSAHNGYQLFMYGDTSLTNTSNNNLKINTVSSTDCGSGCASGSFTTNAWGYAVTHGSSDAPSFLPMTTGYNLLDSSNTSTNGQTIVSFGAKVDYTQTPGIYNNSLNFVAVANVADVIMQSATATDCGSDTPTLMKDSRDNTYYLTQRLADGKCWMLDNLALDLTNTTVQSQLNADTTNATAEALTALKNGGGASPLATAGVTTEWGKNELNGEGGSATPGGSYHPEGWTDNWTVPRIKTDWINTVPNSNYGTDKPNIENQKVGVYYNYCAVSAGSYCYEAGKGTGGASSDVCPKGWRLPTGGASGEFKALYTAVDSKADASANAFNANLITALSLPLSGYYYGGSVANQGAYGYGWSSTISGGNYMHDLYAGKSGVYPAGYGPRWNGLTIRCVLN